MTLFIFLYVMIAFVAFFIMVYDDFTNRRHDLNHGAIILIVYAVMSAVWPATFVAAFIIGVMKPDQR